MEATASAFAYRCLPLNIANAHGWFILNEAPFVAQWNGEAGARRDPHRREADRRRAAPGVEPFRPRRPDLYVGGLFRTEPGYDLCRHRPDQQPQGRHPAADRHRRDRLVALHLHHELAVHAQAHAGRVRARRSDLHDLSAAAQSDRAGRAGISRVVVRSRGRACLSRVERQPVEIQRRPQGRRL